MIKDKFTNLNVSRQRKYQLRKTAEGNCWKCGKEAGTWGLCKPHRVLNRVLNAKYDREYKRKKYGYKRRYLNAKSYREKVN